MLLVDDHKQELPSGVMLNKK